VSLAILIWMLENFPKLRDFLTKLWFIGSVFKAGRNTLAGAFYEFCYIVSWSVLPFALGALTLYVTQIDGTTIFENAISTFENGELLVFTISMLVPVLYMVLFDPDKAGPFPHKLPISTIVTLVIVISASLFALLKAKAVLKPEFVFELSLLLTLLALIIRMLALIYHRLRMPTPNEEDLRAPQQDFVKDYEEHIKTNASSSQNLIDELEVHLKDEQVKK
jgi:hypothetical protein